MRKKHLEKHGDTTDCEGCNRVRAVGAVGARPHTEGCRKCVQDAMEQEDEGREALRKAQRREDDFLEKVARIMEEEEEGTRAKKKVRKEKGQT